MPERLTDEDLKYTVNAELLDSAAKIREERRLLQDRLQKLEAGRQGVSDAVYQRVRSDYLTKLDNCSQRFEALKKSLDTELVTLTEKKIRVEANLKHHREEVEEAKLRNSLGEFSKGDFEKIALQETEEVKRLESSLESFGKEIKRIEELLPSEKQPPPARPSAHPSPVQEAPSSFTSTATKKSTSVDSTSKIFLDKIAPQKEKSIPTLAVMEDGKVIQKIPVDKNINIGRSPSNEIVLNEAKVSRQHAQVQISSDQYVLIDLNSSNGTFVEGKKISEHILNANDEIRIGKATLVFKL